jgi:glycosyltransferase involved in cell wall biosynthesis
MDTADLLVLPSTVESFGTVALEAMARGRLALVSKNCGIVDWPNLADHIFRIESEETVTDAIRRIARLDSETRRDTAAAARRAALELNHSSIVHWVNMLSSTRREAPAGQAQ